MLLIARYIGVSIGALALALVFPIAANAATGSASLTEEVTATTDNLVADVDETVEEVVSDVERAADRTVSAVQQTVESTESELGQTVDEASGAPADSATEPSGDISSPAQGATLPAEEPGPNTVSTAGPKAGSPRGGSDGRGGGISLKPGDSPTEAGNLSGSTDRLARFMRMTDAVGIVGSPVVGLSAVDLGPPRVSPLDRLQGAISQGRGLVASEASGPGVSLQETSLVTLTLLALSLGLVAVGRLALAHDRRLIG